jgi:uncharacterized membrane protein
MSDKEWARKERAREIVQDMHEDEDRARRLILTLASLAMSACLIVSGLVRKVYFLVQGHSSFFDIPLGQQGGLVVLVVGLFVFSINLYTLKITSGWRHWKDLPKHKKAIAHISVAAGVLAVCFFFTILDIR